MATSYPDKEGEVPKGERGTDDAKPTIIRPPPLPTARAKALAMQRKGLVSPSQIISGSDCSSSSLIAAAGDPASETTELEQLASFTRSPSPSTSSALRSSSSFMDLPETSSLDQEPLEHRLKMENMACRLIRRSPWLLTMSAISLRHRITQLHILLRDRFTGSQILDLMLSQPSLISTQGYSNVAAKFYLLCEACDRNPQWSAWLDDAPAASTARILTLSKKNIANLMALADIGDAVGGSLNADDGHLVQIGRLFRDDNNHSNVAEREEDDMNVFSSKTTSSSSSLDQWSSGWGVVVAASSPTEGSGHEDCEKLHNKVKMIEDWQRAKVADLLLLAPSTLLNKSAMSKVGGPLDKLGIDAKRYYELLSDRAMSYEDDYDALGPHIWEAWSEI